jgi:integrase
MIKQFLENGVTCFMVQAYGTRRTGQQVRRRRILKNVSKAAAVKLERELNFELQQLKQGMTFAGMTYQEFLIKEFFGYVDANFPTEYDSLTKTMNKWAKPILHLRIESINPSDIKEILDHAGESLAHSTVKKIRSFLHRSFEFAVQGGLKSNPVASVRNNKKRCKETEPQILTLNEIQTLLTQAKLHRPEWYPIWAFALFTGMRSGEMYALLRQDIDLENKLISVTKSFNKKVGIKSTKSGRNRRISISEKILPFIKELMLQGPNKEPLLPRPYQWKKGDQSRVLRDFCQSICITSIKFHSLRSCFAVQMLLSGSSLITVQSLLGHSSVQSMIPYILISGVDIANATDALQIELPETHINNVVDLFGT